ncbi:hypothetical protein M758_3G088900 [Ceratodon purpureus]|nr:hypothetical protein M758_3G088900 [Ceratodon purpureus]
MGRSCSCQGTRLTGRQDFLNSLLKKCFLILLTTICKDMMVQAAIYPAIFTFGDSLVDNGNNNYLASLARANFPPNGCDFGSGVPTGRFCNGNTLSDYIGYFLGIDPPPAYFDYLTFNLDIKKGVNFASGAGGILDESGYNYLERIPMSQQTEYFALVKQTLIRDIGNVTTERMLKNALYIIVLGSNDYINNYMLRGSAAHSMYTPDEYADFLVLTYSKHIENLYAIGARKFLVTSTGPLGCLPYELWQLNATDGKCFEEPNRWVQIYNSKLQAAMNNLTLHIPNLYILYGNAYDKVYAYVQSPENYGFQNGNMSCCGRGIYNAEAPCIPTTPFCEDRSSYVFWDRFHPSDRCNLLVGSLFISGGPPDIYPINLLQLATKQV